MKHLLISISLTLGVLNGPIAQAVTVNDDLPEERAVKISRPLPDFFVTTVTGCGENCTDQAWTRAKIEGTSTVLAEVKSSPTVPKGLLTEKIRKEWEGLNGQKWPTKKAHVIEHGEVVEKDIRAQIHHIIPQQYGGPHKGWNAQPIFQSEHQGGVHGAASPLSEILKKIDP